MYELITTWVGKNTGIEFLVVRSIENKRYTLAYFDDRRFKVHPEFYDDVFAVLVAIYSLDEAQDLVIIPQVPT